MVPGGPFGGFCCLRDGVRGGQVASADEFVGSAEEEGSGGGFEVAVTVSGKMMPGGPFGMFRLWDRVRGGQTVSADTFVGSAEEEECSWGYEAAVTRVERSGNGVLGGVELGDCCGLFCEPCDREEKMASSAVACHSDEMRVRIS